MSDPTGIRWQVYDSWQVYPTRAGRTERIIAVVPAGWEDGTVMRETVAQVGRCGAADDAGQARSLAIAERIVADHNRDL